MSDSQTGLYEGDKIMLEGNYGRIYVLEVEKFRDCLGVFMSDTRRKVGEFTPLCNLYGFGSDSKMSYQPNYGEYTKNPVALWSQLPKDTPVDY